MRGTFVAKGRASGRVGYTLSIGGVRPTNRWAELKRLASTRGRLLVVRDPTRVRSETFARDAFHVKSREESVVVQVLRSAPSRSLPRGGPASA